MAVMEHRRVEKPDRIDARLAGIEGLLDLTEAEVATLDRERYGIAEIVCGHGDMKLVWDRNNLDEVEIARQNFTKLKERGFSAFAADKEGKQAGPVPTFDPNAEALIMVPANRGG